MVQTSSKGFSLLESLIVFSLIALLIGLVINRPFHQLEQVYQQQTFINQLHYDLKLAKNQAIMHSIAIEVNFSYKDQTIWLKSSENPQLSRQLLLPPGYKIIEGGSFHYLADGRVDKFMTITLSNANQVYFAIKFQLGSGIFEIQS